MSNDRGPDYEFFAPPPAGPPAPPPGPGPRLGGWGPEGPFATRPVPAGTGFPTWATALIASAGALVILSVLAAIAVPVFLGQRAKAQYSATTISLPASFDGQPRSDSPVLDQLSRQTGMDAEFPRSVAGAYGAGTVDAVVVIAAKARSVMDEADQKNARAGFVRGFSDTAALTLAPVADPGPLGGWMGCGAGPQNLTVCLASDHATLVAVFVGPGNSAPAAVARRAREAVVRR